MVAPLAATTSIFKKGRKYIFMVVSPAEIYLEGLADMAAKRGLKTVAIVNEDTLFPKASVAGFAELAKKRGMQVVLQEAYPKGNTDFSALLVKIKSLNPDVIAAGTYFDDAVAITREELNVNPKVSVSPSASICRVPRPLSDSEVYGGYPVGQSRPPGRRNPRRLQKRSSTSPLPLGRGIGAPHLR